VIVGKIYFLLVRIKIKHMEIAIIKRETTGAGPNTYHENENIAKLVPNHTNAQSLFTIFIGVADPDPHRFWSWTGSALI
jgi:hypothetical protein